MMIIKGFKFPILISITDWNLTGAFVKSKKLPFCNLFILHKQIGTFVIKPRKNNERMGSSVRWTIGTVGNVGGKGCLVDCSQSLPPAQNNILCDSWLSTN